MSQEALGGALERTTLPLPCRPPIIFEPPFPLVSEPQIWITTTAPEREEWGGAAVCWSEEEDGDQPNLVAGSIHPKAVVGRLLTDLPAFPSAQWPPDTLEALLDDDGILPASSPGAADRWQSLLYVGDGRNDYELLAYSRATFLGPLPNRARHYRLEGKLVRGLYGTVAGPRRPCSSLALLDDCILAVSLPYRLIAWRALLTFRVISLNGPDWEDAQELGLCPLLPYRVEGRWHASHQRWRS